MFAFERKAALSKESPRQVAGGVVQRKCAACEDQEAQQVRRKVAGGGAAGMTAPRIVHEALRSPGEPLDSRTRAFMEPRFGRSFADVKVHADAVAGASARAIGALAYTSGNHVVFAPGQYSGSPHRVQHLLAHELAHVAQQGPRPRAPAANLRVADPADPAEIEADRAAAAVTAPGSEARATEVPLVGSHGSPAAPAIHRVPAPPVFDGTTGSVDLTKVQFTPIPDFEAGALTSPLTLKPVLRDASLVHLSWELYDPSDNMIRGFSTIPGSPNARTATFDLVPADFGTKAANGRYTMRLVGHDAAHKPVAYFDRMFFVLSSDLKTGTARTNTFGDLTFTQYGKTDGDFAKGTDYVVDIKLAFAPNPGGVTCPEIGFLQVLESSDPAGASNHRFAGPRKAARATPLNYSVDRAESGPSPFYGTFKNAAKAIVPSGTTYKPGTGGAAPTPAELEDHPTWSQPTTDRFETCATCRKGTNAGQVYGCVTWGFSVDAAGKVTLMPRSYSSSPSDTLKASLGSWNTWRAAQPTPGDFEAAPAPK